MSFDGIEKLVPGRCTVLPPDVSFHESTSTDHASDCRGCGAPLQPRAVECSWCKRPTGHPGDWGAMIEATSLTDPTPRYVPAWPGHMAPSAIGVERIADSIRCGAGTVNEARGALTVGYGITDSELGRVRSEWFNRHAEPSARRLLFLARLARLVRLVRAVWPR